MNRTKNMPAWVGDLLLFITAVVWGGGFIGVAKALSSLSPFYMIAMRFGIASLLMLMIFWKKLKEIRKKDVITGCMIGCFLFLGFALQTTGAIYLNVGKLAFLTALNVILVPFISAVVFKERVKKYNIVSGLIATIGFAFLNLSEGTILALGGGEILGILCALCFAVHIAVVGHYASKMDVIILSILQMMTCCLLGIICAVVFEKPPTQISADMMLPVLYLGVFSTFIAFLCQTIGQKYTSASRTAIILSMESVVGTMLSVVILKEQLTHNMIVGAGLILTAVIIAEYLHAKTNHLTEIKEKYNESKINN